MVLHLRRNIFTWSAVLLLCVYLSYALHTTTLPKSNEDNSSSEETVEDCNETVRQKRSAELPDSGGDDKTKDKGIQPRIGIPGLPDPATILKVAEILKTVGEQVIPILVEGNNETSTLTEHFGNSLQFLSRFKKEIDQFTQNRFEKMSEMTINNKNLMK